MRAMNHFDVAAHSPHPPGYPVYVGAAKPLYWLTGDAQLALQLVSIVGAISAVCLVWLLGRRLGATRREATCAAALLAASPGFAFNANVGMSDALGTAGALAGILALVAAWDRPQRLPLAAAVCAVALGVRPQLAAALLATGAAVVFRAARVRQLGQVLAAAASAVAVSLLCWLPAVLLTGPGRFLAAMRGQYEFVTAVEHSGGFSGASLGHLADRWLVAPIGSEPLALAFWVLLAAGATCHWRAGRRRLVAVCLAAGGGYYVFAAWALHVGPSVRYALPALPLLAILVAGIGASSAPLLRRSALAAVGLWCLVAVTMVAGPALDVRRRRPAPVSEAMDWIAANFKPERTTVVYSGDLRAHATFELAPKGFHVVAGEPGQTRPLGLAPDIEVLLLTTRPVAGTEVVFAARWDVVQLTRLSRGMYDRCVVARAQTASDRRAAVEPLLAAVTAGALASAKAGSRLLVPSAAHAWGKFGSFWTTDLVLCNSDPAVALAVELSVLARPGTEGVVVPATQEVAAGATVALPDVLLEKLSFSGYAALQLRSERPFIALWRTYDAKRVRAGKGAALLPALRPEDAADHRELDVGAAWPEEGATRCTIGLVNLHADPADVELTLESGKVLTSRRLRVPALSRMQIDDVFESTDARPLRVRFQASRSLLAYAAVVETATGRAAYVIP